MRERRAAHVRPLPPSSDRLRTRHVAPSAPSRNLLRRYGSVGTRRGMPAPVGLGASVAFLALAAVVLVVGANILLGVVSGLAGAFDDALTHQQSLPPASPGASGASLNTPTLDTPDNDGYTNKATVALSGAIPAAAAGKSGYLVRVYSIDQDGKRSKVAELPVGPTVRFTTGAVNLVPGPNTFVATLVTPSVEGQASPPVVYTLDTSPPPLTIATPANGATLSTASVVVSGKTDPGVTVTVHNRQSPGGSLSSKVVGEDGHYALTIALVAGNNSINVTATDQAGNVTSQDLTVKRTYGKLSAHVSVSPSKFKGSATTQLTLTVRATSQAGGPLAGASVAFTLQVPGLSAVVSQGTTDQTGTAVWKITVSGATAGIGTASVMVSSADGNTVSATASITTT